VIWQGSDRAGTSRSVVLPHLDDRTGWAGDVERGAAPDGPTLLGAVRMLGAQLDQDYYRTPNIVAAQLIRAHTHNAKPNTAVMAGVVKPCAVVLPDADGREHAQPVYRQMIKGKWSRPLTEVEEGHVFVHQFDLNAAELLSGMTAPLGSDAAPTHRVGPLKFTKPLARNAGYVRLAEAPVPNLLLPTLKCEPDMNGEIWVTIPDAALLFELGTLPDIVESYIWPDAVRALDATTKVLRQAREYLVERKTDDPAAALAYAAFKPIYTNLAGYLARTAGPRNESDALWRPDWRDMALAQTYANMYRQLQAAGKHTGRFPIAMSADSVWYTSDSADPREALPRWANQGRAMRLGTGGGQWKSEGSVPLAAVREFAGTGRFFKEFDRELKRLTGKAA
jgi:hypothetical protein